MAALMYCKLVHISLKNNKFESPVSSAAFAREKFRPHPRTTHATQVDKSVYARSKKYFPQMRIAKYFMTWPITSLKLNGANGLKSDFLTQAIEIFSSEPIINKNFISWRDI